MGTIDFQNTATLAAHKLPLSHSASAGQYTYLSGQFAVVPETGKLINGGLAEQARQTFANIEATLTSLGRTFADVIKTTVYLRDMSDFAEMNSIYETYFPNGFPARTTVAVLGLPMDARIEIEIVVFTPR
ncbi:MAG: RidA family protein [Hyphomicrobium sp.]|nr:RidA family protein [Hyphomicrobium sp.]